MSRSRRRLAAWREALDEGPKPRRVVAIIVGAMIGFTPLFGLHLLICVVAARLLRLNVLITYGVANISIPPLVPLLGFVSIQAGSMILEGHWLELNRAALAGRPISDVAQEFFLHWLVGGPLVGALFGMLLAGILLVACRVPWLCLGQPRVIATRRSSARRALRAAVERYRGLPPWHSWHAAFKAELDPAPAALAALVRPNEFVQDVGTGLGLLPVTVALMGRGRSAVGFDHDPRRVAAAIHAARGLPCSIVQGDATTTPLERADVIAIVDVLHYLNPDERHALIERAAAALSPGGRLLIREADSSRRGLARLTRGIERVVVACGWTKAPRVLPVTGGEIRAAFRAAGLGVHSIDLSMRGLPGNMLFIGVRRKAS